MDLSLRSAKNVEFVNEHVCVDLLPDADGHVCISDEIPQPSLDTVEDVLNVVDQERECIAKELHDIDEINDMLLEEYKKYVDSGDSQKRGASETQHRLSISSDFTNKRQKVPDAPAITPKVEESGEKEQQPERESYIKKVISLDLDTEDEELLVAAEGESDSASEG